MKRTLLAVLAMVAGLAVTASALEPLDFDPEGPYTILLIDDPTWPDPLFATGDPYESNDGYWGTLIDFLKGMGLDEIQHTCSVAVECNTSNGTWRRCPDDKRIAVFDAVDLDGVLIRGNINPAFPSIPDKAEMMLLATAVDNNPEFMTTLDDGVDIFLDFTTAMTALTNWGIAPETGANILAAFELFCEKQDWVGKPAISGAMTYDPTSPKVVISIATATAGATIRYTTDGSNVGSGSPIYTEAFEFNGAVGAAITVKAKAYKDTWATSDQASATFTLQASAPIPPDPIPCEGTWEWEEKAADEEAKAFSGYKIIADPTFAAAAANPASAPLVLPIARQLAGAQVIAGVKAALLGAGLGLDDATAQAVAEAMVNGTATAAQICAMLGVPTDPYEPVIQGYIDQANGGLVLGFVTVFSTLGELIGTLGEDLPSTLNDDVKPISVALPLHVDAFAALEGLGTEMNMALTALLDDLLSGLLAPIEATEALPGAPAGGFTIPQLCGLLGSNHAVLGLKTGGLLHTVATNLGLPNAATVCAAAGDTFAAGYLVMDGVKEAPTMPILGAGKAEPPLSVFGDYDGDGITNIEAYNLVMNAGGTLEDYVAAAGGGAGGLWPGNPDLPAAGLFGLAALVSAITAGGAFALRRK